MLQVRFDRTVTRRMPDGSLAHISHVRVFRVIRGSYDRETIEVAFLRLSSCDVIPPNGAQGYITGQLQVLPDGSTAFVARSSGIPWR